MMTKKIYYCDNCGAVIDDFNENIGICSFCGSKVSVPNRYEQNPTLLEIPYGVTEISDGQYKDNKIIEKVIIPETVLYIGNNSFENCIVLSEINIPRSVKVIGNSAFKHTLISELFLPNTIEILGKDVFMDCYNLSKVTIESGFSYNMDQTFKWCNNLCDVKCDLYDFYPSINKTNETPYKKDDRPTFFDAFQATDFFYTVKNAFKRSYDSGRCFLCGGEIQKKIFSKSYCLNCGCDYEQVRYLK